MTKSKLKDPWEEMQPDMSKQAVQKSFLHNLHYVLGKDRYTTTYHDLFMALSLAIRDRIVDRWIRTQQNFHKNNVKRVYYLSMEFLIGRLLANHILNLGLEKEVAQALKDLELDYDQLVEEEPDAGLGNGGLGRLAACFLDSMATLGIPAHGYGIRYDYGIFQQKIMNGYQLEAPEEWLKRGNPWEFQRPEYAVTVQFYGHVYHGHGPDGRLRAEWIDTQDVVAMPYDIPVPGARNDVVNTLRLWSARSSEEFDLGYFQSGDYEKAVYEKMYSENISRVLYPNDSNALGKELRLKQEYFFTCASIADIIRRFKAENTDFRMLPDKAVIQLNDTHPALAVAELMRVLIDLEGLDWDTAWDVTVRTFAYTNHTVMPEALETWPVTLFERLLPRHMEIIFEINARFLREVANRYPGNTEKLRDLSLIDESNPKRVRMAYLAIIGSHSVNGVSALHSNILKTDIFRDFYELYPERFNNKTNGITHRRWLMNSNPGLSDLLASAAGEQWHTDLASLKKIIPMEKDRSFVEKWQEVKNRNKVSLSNYIFRQYGLRVDPASLFDVQIKRIHEYKRQVLFGFYILQEYLKFKAGHTKAHPRTFIVAGKAAPGYFMAKLIIKFINSIAEVVNRDRSLRNHFKVIFLENYRVSLAEKIFPASDLSEQISTAGMEASGTGCMKFRMNGALTVGTLDGANIEIAEAVGQENIFTFGLTVEDIQKLQKKGYHPEEYIRRSSMLSEVFHLVESNFLSPNEPGVFTSLMSGLRQADPYYICGDFDAYCRIQDKISENFKNESDWTRKAIHNVASSGRFSSDRTIAEYAENVWDVPLLNQKS